MSLKRIYILDGHPAESSLSRVFAEIYAHTARAAGHDVRLTHLSALTFDPDFGKGNYTDWKALEPELEQVIADIEWSDHIVLTTPMWWGGLPAKLKGLIDRVLLPGRAFDTRTKTALGLPSPLLSGRTGRVFLTSDTPVWFMRIVYRNALVRQIRGQIMNFIGVHPARVTHFSGASTPANGQVDKWCADVRRIAQTAT